MVWAEGYIILSPIGIKMTGIPPAGIDLTSPTPLTAWISTFVVTEGCFKDQFRPETDVERVHLFLYIG